MLTVETRQAIDPEAAKYMDTDDLRRHFHVGGLFREGEIRLIYSHYDRLIVGGCIAASGAELVLDKVAEAGTASVLDRREMSVVCLSDSGRVSAGESYEMGRGDMLYLGMGAGPVTFSGGRFYIVSAPAHATYPSRHIRIEEAASVSLGAPETSNERTIYQFVHPEVMQSCQLVMGMTKLGKGSVWNTMPAHLHDRRSEAYLYIDLGEENRVFHMMGRPDETRHMVLKNEEGALSPPWSIHCGAGTGSYTFIWAMAGDNVDYKDVEMVAMEDLR